LEDGRFLSWSEDSTLRLWNEEGGALRVLEGHRGTVRGALALTNGRFLSWSDDGTLLLWNREGRFCSAPKRNQVLVNGAIALTKGRFLTWSENGALCLWGSKGALCVVFERRSNIRGAFALSDGSFIFWTDDYLCLWKGEKKPICEWRWKEAPEELLEAVASLHGNHPPISNGITLITRNLTAYVGPTRWHGNSDIDPRALRPDGTAVVTLASGHLFCLKLYRGGDRVPLELLKATQ
jgi:WD40 repeat protein